MIADLLVALDESAVQGREEGHAPAVEMLRQVSVAVDTLWRQALVAAEGETAIRLAEASHGIHRALIALTTPSDLVSARR